MQQAEVASSGAVQSGFPSREAVAQAGAELAQRLGLAPDQALDTIVSTVLQQGWGGERGLSVRLINPSILSGCSLLMAFNRCPAQLTLASAACSAPQLGDRGQWQ